MPDFIEKNRIIKKMITGQVISFPLLKHYYRELCKTTHPDLTLENSENFLKLQEEYQEARKFLEQFKQDYLLKKRQAAYWLINPRIEFYNALQYYTISGLHSVRIRRKKELKNRNFKILKEVLYWANWYNKEFIPLFIDYNKMYLRPLTHSETEKQLKKVKKLFLCGLNWFFKYQLFGIETAYRTAKSYVSDVIYELSNINRNFYKKSLLEFAKWVEQELEFPPACIKNEKY